MRMRRGCFLLLSWFFIFPLRGFPQGNLVLDARWESDDQSKIYLFGEELNYEYDMPAGSLFLQGLNQTPKGERSDFRLGEAWLNLRFLDDSLLIKVGRFPLPFGLNSFYDAHFAVIQPLYQQSLGLRLDEGVSISGSYGPYLFTLSASQGTGSSDSKKTTYIIRAEREIPKNPWAEGKLGFSLLSGNLPLVDEEGLTSETVDKTRIGLDFRVNLGKTNLLGEAHIGGDEDINAGGFFLLAEIPFKERLNLLLSWRSFNFDLDEGREVRRWGGGISWDMDEHSRLSLVYQRDSYHKKDIYTLQLLTHYSLSDLVKKRF